MLKKNLLSIFLVLFQFQIVFAICETDLEKPYSFGNIRPAHESATLRVLVWNVLKLKRSGVLADLVQLSSNSDVSLLQEAALDPSIETTMVNLLPDFQQIFYPSFCNSSSRAFGVQTNSKFPVSNSQNWPAPQPEPFSSIHKMSGYSQIKWNNQIVHLINTHALNFNGGGPFENQIDDLAEKIKTLKGPVIWAGDFNTWNFWSDARLEHLLSHAEELGLKHVQFSEDPRTMVLDHIFYRGLTLKNSRLYEVSTSDHFPLFAEFEKE